MVGELWTRIRNQLYDKKILRSETFPGFVLSVGNLTWGGTGKTSLVKTLAKYLIARGLKVGIVSRGYRRETREARIVSDGESLRCSWKNSGDEPYLLAQELPNAIVVVAEKKGEGIRMLQRFHPDVILLDDGFQHRKVHRDLDILLIDASEDITAQRVIPFGKLREEPSSVSRASALVLTHSDKAHERTLEWSKNDMRPPVFHARYSIVPDIDVSGQKIGAFCGIGAPQHFFEMLRKAGGILVASKAFRDHHVFTRQEIEDFRAAAESEGAKMLVTTAKDAIRIDPDLLESFVRVIRVELQIVEEALFFAFVMDKLESAMSNEQ